MRTLFTEIEKRLAAGEDMVLVTVIASSGSTPRGSGARMLVDKTGRVTGTIGGGAVEHRAILQATEALERRESSTRQYILRRNEVEDLGMICGGDVEVLIQFIPGDHGPMRRVVRAALEGLDRDQNLWLITDTASGETGVYTRDSGLIGLELDSRLCQTLLIAGSKLAQVEGRRYMAESIRAAGRVVIFGGGHIGQELVPVLARLSFRCIVFDDREEFTRPELFPGAEQVIRGDFTRIANAVSVGKNDYAIVVTRGHAFDYQATEQMLRAGAGYLGVIGSKKKMAKVKERLLEAGHSQAAIDGIYTPIGLPIAAETPAEIAVSIAAELIQVRAARLKGESGAG